MIEDPRELAQPPFVARGDAWPVLSLAQALQVLQALGLDHSLPTGTLTLGELHGYVLLHLDGHPIAIKPRAEWRRLIDAWVPSPIFLKRD